MFSSLIYFYLFFLYISFGTFFGQGIAPASQRGVKQCNQNMESDILRQHSLALSTWPSKAFKSHRLKREIPASCETKNSSQKKALYQIISLLEFSNKLKEINNTTPEKNSQGSKKKTTKKQTGLWT